MLSLRDHDQAWLVLHQNHGMQVVLMQNYLAEGTAAGLQMSPPLVSVLQLRTRRLGS